MSEFRRRLMMMQWENTPIVFEDPEVKRICVGNFGGESGITNWRYGTIGIKGIAGELTYRQALGVSQFVDVFRNNKIITKFNELQHFRKLVNISGLFLGCSELIETTIPEEHKLDGVTRDVFHGCKKLVRVHNFTNIRKIINLMSMFRSCENLEYIDFTGIDMSELTRVTFAFDSCTSLKSINFGNANFSKVSDFHYLFNKCGNLEELINFEKDTFGVAVTYSDNRYFNGWVFNGAKKLVTENFIMNVPTNMSKSIGGNFFGELDVKYIDLQNYTNLKSMSFAAFSACPNIEGVTLPDNTTIVINGTFYAFQNAKFKYHNSYIRFFSETPPIIKNNYTNHIPLNWYVPSNAIQSYRDYINSINSYFTFADKIIIKPLDDWESDCDTFGWTKY